MPPHSLSLYVETFLIMRILSEKREICLADKFLSPRIVKDALKNKFNIAVIEERTNYLKVRLIRLARLYGGPCIWPQATVEIWIKNQDDKLIYEFFWPEYFLLFSPFVILFFSEGQFWGRLLFLLAALLFFGTFIHLDTRWASRRLRKAFESI